MDIQLEKFVSGGQVLGTLSDGRKAFVWGGLPGEKVTIRITKKKSKYVEAVVEEVLQPSLERTEPVEPESYLSTSPWQIINFAAEQKHKAQLVDEAFLQHHVTLPSPTTIYSDDTEYGYRNKLEFSWYSDLDAISGVDTLDIAFYRRGSRGKIPVEGSSLASPEINQLALSVRDLLRSKNISARQLKTLLIRTNQTGQCVWQLYTKEKLDNLISTEEADKLPTNGGGGEVIYSDPRSPASVITERLANFGETTLQDKILGVPFNYAAESFFQINIPVYEQALKDMRAWASNRDNFGSESADSTNFKIVDLYSGVGSIGLTIGGDNVTLVEVNQSAVTEMKRNIELLGKNARAVLAPSEKALDYITSDKVIIVDPPRAGLHADVINRLLDQLPPRIIYLSCNPVTQARDVALLLEKYQITHNQAYNFFPRTPHIENLVVLNIK